MTTVSNNLSGNTGTVTGTTQTISNVHLTEHQSDLLIINSFILVAILIVCIFSTIKSYVKKSCVGCKRLVNCEHEIKKLKKNATLNNIVDYETLNVIAKDIAEIKKRIIKNGTIHS